MCLWCSLIALPRIQFPISPEISVNTLEGGTHNDVNIAFNRAKCPPHLLLEASSEFVENERILPMPCIAARPSRGVIPEAVDEEKGDADDEEHEEV